MPAMHRKRVAAAASRRVESRERKYQKNQSLLYNSEKFKIFLLSLSTRCAPSQAPPSDVSARRLMT